MNENILSTFFKNMLEEKRIVIVDNSFSIVDFENNLIKAITLNENLKSQYNYTFKPQDLIVLAKSSSLNTLLKDIEKVMPLVKAKPMYPNFPKQVMEMDEAIFRFHQMVHYFSTYGVEFFTGLTVSKGWLPNVEDTEKTNKDITLLDCKVLDIMKLDDAYEFINKNVLSKRERFTIPEQAIVKTCILHSHLKEFDITFKENIFTLISDELSDLKNTYILLTKLCKHTGDVLDYIYYCIINIKNKKQFKTSEKRMFVNVLESFDFSGFGENLALKRERNLFVLRYLSYNRFSKSWLHKQMVAELRNKELCTWMALVESKLYYLVYKTHKIQSEKLSANIIMSKNISVKKQLDFVNFVGQRPTMLLRMIRRFLRLGFNTNVLYSSLGENIDKIPTQTLVCLLNYFSQEFNDTNVRYTCDIEINKIIYQLLKHMLSVKFQKIKTPLKNKKVYLDMDKFNLDKSTLDVNNKLEEGGYMQSGLAFNIPDNIKVLRFLVYWNDKGRVDIDLHSYNIDSFGEERHIGYNGSYNTSGVTYSGDITHSDATEYIDIDIQKAVKNNIIEIKNEIRLYNHRDYESFKLIDEIFVGMQAVNSTSKKTELFNINNLFFYHDLTSSNKYFIVYSKINLEDRYMKLLNDSSLESNFSLDYYIKLLLVEQDSIIVDNKEEADIILTLDKSLDENGLSLIDNNYFMDN